MIFTQKSSSKFLLKEIINEIYMKKSLKNENTKRTGCLSSQVHTYYDVTHPHTSQVWKDSDHLRAVFRFWRKILLQKCVRWELRGTSELHNLNDFFKCIPRRVYIFSYAIWWVHLSHLLVDCAARQQVTFYRGTFLFWHFF